eukprot:gene13724-13846_t
MANIKSLSDINGDDGDDNKKFNDYYAGGEKSGQLIRGAPEDEGDDDYDEDDKVGSIFHKAKTIGAKQGTADDLPTSGAFAGQGRTLAGPGASGQRGAGERNHVVKFYRNSIFTVDDGPPRTMDDPANLDFINSVGKGECPRELDPGDSETPVTVNLLRVEEDYVMPNRMVARMNHSHTVADIRRFIRASRPDMTASYQLMTGFPPAAIADEAQTLEAAGLLNAVISQRK